MIRGRFGDVPKMSVELPTCSSTFKMLKHAFIQKHIPDLERCRHCPHFGSREEVARHAEEAHREVFICDVCGKEWRNKNRWVVC